VEHGYPVDDPGTANLAIASNAVGEKFNCLAMTLEQPFKDTANAPRPVQVIIIINHNNKHNKHDYAGATDSFTHRRVL
jgi:transglutaminase/protease-like cytokinesis protein 3